MDPDVVKNSLRIAGLAVLLTGTLIDPVSVQFIVRPELQIVIAAVIVFCVLFVDHIFGFILGLAALTTYTRVFMHKYGRTPFSMSLNGRGALTPYVTPKNLEDAQNNVVDPKEMTTPYVGAKGIYGERVYSAQGLDTELPGLEKSVGEDFTKPTTM
jgi:hypothetical protein